MAMTVADFVAETRRILYAEPDHNGRKKVVLAVRRALQDPAFVAEALPEGTPERKVIYEDPTYGFTILAHAYEGAKNSSPHDHAASWAIYGQAVGETIMTDYECLARPDGTSPGRAKPTRDYSLKPGDAYLYEPGVLHSPRRDGATRLLRIEGLNMEKFKRLPYERA
jgi:hypothetical protein